MLYIQNEIIKTIHFQMILLGKRFHHWAWHFFELALYTCTHEHIKIKTFKNLFKYPLYNFEEKHLKFIPLSFKVLKTVLVEKIFCMLELDKML